MPRELSTTSHDAAVAVHAFFQSPIDALLDARDTFGPELRALDTSRPLTPRELDALVQPYSEALRAFEIVPVFGAGFVSARDLTELPSGHLSWWQGRPARKLVPAAESVNKEQIDYTSFEWFRVPRETGAPHVVGPFVDYLCNDEYTITFSAPVVVAARFCGVVALDVLVEAAETRLLPLLESTAEPLAVVSRGRRVLVSSDPRFGPGDSIRGVDVDVLGDELPGDEPGRHGFALVRFRTAAAADLAA